MKAEAGGTGKTQGDIEERTARPTMGGQGRFYRRDSRRDEQVRANEDKIF